LFGKAIDFDALINAVPTIVAIMTLTILSIGYTKVEVCQVAVHHSIVLGQKKISNRILPVT